MFFKRFLKILFPLLLSATFLFGQKSKVPFYTNDAKIWADSVYDKLNYFERIGQIFMVAAYSNKDASHIHEIDSLIQKYYIGGLIFFQGGPMRQAELTNHYQSISRVPLMIGIDGEWGLSMRLDSTIRFPRQMTLAAANNDSIVYAIGKDIARQCKRLGIHINFAPVVDINNNPANPVINSRAFSDDKQWVAHLGSMYMKGMQDEGVLACVKHFPGHGNTNSDSHYTLPIISQSYAEMDSMELYPFRSLFNQGAASVMVAHLFIPSLDSTPNRASTLSPRIVTDLLKKDLNYDGLIFTDALNMKGVSNYFSPGELEHNAFLAGNDVLLFSENIPAAYERIHYAIQNCEYEENILEQRVKKILMAKYWVGLHRAGTIDLNNLSNEISANALQLSDKAFGSAVTLLKNDQQIPFSFDESEQIVSLVINDSLNNLFQNYLREYGITNTFSLNRFSSDSEVNRVVERVNGFKKMIISLHNTSTLSANDFNVPKWLGSFMNRLNSKMEITFVVLGNSYILERINGLARCSAVVLAYEDTYYPQQKCAELLFGAASAKGRLPVNTGQQYKRGLGIDFVPSFNQCLGRSQWEEGGIDAEVEPKIDSIVNASIAMKAFPGCQILVARNGKILLEKSYGTKTYDGNFLIGNNDLYDIASVTKIAATTLAIMKLHEEGKIDIHKKASRYYTPLRKLNKRNITIEQLLTHSSGLKSWIPFYQATLKSGKPSYDLYHFYPDPNYTVRVCDSMYLLGSYTEKIWQEINESPMSETGQYVYSDLNMLLLQKIVEEVSDESLDTFMLNNFYNPLHLERLTYLPREKFKLEEIVPTEFDSVFRKRLIHGDVHDPAAAMLGGVGGHAGLFSNAYSLAVIMQMLANKGIYGGIRFLDEETIELFTQRYYKSGNNRRALGFDRPIDDRSKSGPTAASVSEHTYGHTGFTGTAAWVDPDANLVYIFLSNRVHPNSANNLLAEKNIRTNIQQLLYDYMLR